jgi:hypothetical protein
MHHNDNAEERHHDDGGEGEHRAAVHPTDQPVYTQREPILDPCPRQ